MKKVLKRIIIVLILLVLIFIVVYARIFLIGSVRNMDSGISVVSVENDMIELNSFASDSASAYKKFKYRIEEDNLYVKVYQVVASNIYRSGNGHIIIEGNFSHINNIYVEDNKQHKIIWSR